MAKKKTDKSAAKAKPDVKEIPVPTNVTELRTIATSLSKVADIPENMVASRDKMVASMNRLADRIYKGLGAAEKKAAKEARKAEREKKQAEKAETKKQKKLNAIKALREKLEKLEAEVAPADDKK